VDVALGLTVKAAESAVIEAIRAVGSQLIDGGWYVLELELLAIGRAWPGTDPVPFVTRPLRPQKQFVSA